MNGGRTHLDRIGDVLGHATARFHVAAHEPSTVSPAR